MGSRELEGRVAWVTGGASGMGRAAALALARMGAHVAIGSLVAEERGEVPPEQNLFTPPASRLAEVKAEIEAQGGRALALRLDVRSQASIDAGCAAIASTLGQVDILVNAAGSTVRAPVASLTDDLWARMIETNLTGPFRTIRACLPGMTARGFGRIVNIASTAANLGAPLYAAYAASKAGLAGFSRCVALEGAAHGVTCNVVNPGYTETEQGTMGLSVQVRAQGLDVTPEEYGRSVAAGLPQKRFLAPEEIGSLIAFLCTGAARGITGEDITIAMGSPW